MTRRALVLGGGGHFGAALCAALVARGWQVVASTRSAGSRGLLDSLPVTRVVGDDTRPGVIEGWADGAELIVDAAAPYALTLHDPAASHGDRLAGAEARSAALLACAARRGAVVVHVGSVLTRTQAGAGLTARLVEAAHPYFRMKRRLEQVALKAARAGQPVVVVNPSSFLGPGNLRPVQHCFVASVLSGGMPASFPDIINVMDVRDAAEATLRTVEAGFFGTPVTLSGTDISVHDLTDLICALGAAPRPPRWRGLAAGAAVIYGAENLLALAGRASAYPSLPVLLTLASRATPTGPEQAALDLALRPLEQTLRDEIAWYRARGSVVPAHQRRTAGGEPQ